MITPAITFQCSVVLVNLPLNLVEFVSDLIELRQLVSALVVEVVLHPATVLLEGTVQNRDQLLLDSLELLLQRGLHLALVVLKVAHDVVLLAGDPFLQPTQLLLALPPTVREVCLPGLPFSIGDWFAGR